MTAYKIYRAFWYLWRKQLHVHFAVEDWRWSSHCRRNQP